MSVFSLTCLIHILDKMAENMNNESEITSTVEDTWFVIIPEVLQKMALFTSIFSLKPV